MKVTLSIALAVVLGAALLSRADAANQKKCRGDSIAEVSDDGDILKMASGAVWDVVETDRSVSTAWLEDDKVRICADAADQKGKAARTFTIINSDEDDEEARATRVN